MTERDELAALVDAAMEDLDEFYGPGTHETSERIVNEIWGRWRLMPIEEEPYRLLTPQEMADMVLTQMATEAASELTQHDQAAGIYEQPC